MTVARRFIARSPSRARTREKGKVASRSDFEGSNLVARKLEDMVEFHRAAGKIAGQPRAYNDPVCLCVSVKRQQDVSVLCVRLLFPLLDRLAAMMILLFITDRAVISETERELCRILRFFSSQVRSDWFGYIEFHWDYFVREFLYTCAKPPSTNNSVPVM
jgi:hypothetical protein